MGTTRTAGQDEGFKPPYNLAFRTFLNLVMRMEEEDPPPRIDRTYLGNMAGSDQTAVLAALRGFDLIGDGNEVKPELLKLAKDNDDRPNMIAALLERYYPKQVELSKQNATSGMLEESFAEYGYSADTRRKAVTFFLKAAEYAGIHISPHFNLPKARGTRKTVSRPKSKPAPATSTGGGSRVKGRRSRKSTDDADGKTVSLRSGGWVRVSYDADFFTLNTRDREFVLGLIDSLRAYEDRKSLPQGEGGGQI